MRRRTFVAPSFPPVEVAKAGASGRRGTARGRYLPGFWWEVRAPLLAARRVAAVVAAPRALDRF
jgi:hypothetical protein